MYIIIYIYIYIYIIQFLLFYLIRTKEEIDNIEITHIPPGTYVDKVHQILVSFPNLKQAWAWA